MVMNRIIAPISSLSGFDMLGDVRAHKVLGGVYHDTLREDMDYAAMHRVDMYQNLPKPDSDAVLAFETVMEASQYMAPISDVSQAHHVAASQALDFSNTLAMADGAHVLVPPVSNIRVQPAVTPDSVVLPKPDTLVAEGVRQLHASAIEASSIEPSWMEAIPEPEMDAFQRGLKNLEALLEPSSTGVLNQKDLLQLQFAMGEINAYKEIGLQVLKKSATNVETVLKQQG